MPLNRFEALCMKNTFIVINTERMKKRSEAMQTLNAGCSKVYPQTHRQERLQYTVQLSTQCKKRHMPDVAGKRKQIYNATMENFTVTTQHSSCSNN